MTLDEGSLCLDARQRAMLEEMGVKVWWPAASRPHGVDASGGDGAASAQPRPGADAQASMDTPQAARIDTRAVASTPQAPAAFADAPADASRPAARPEPAPQRTGPAAQSPVPVPADAAMGGAVLLVDAPRRIDGGSAMAPGGWLVVADMPPGPEGRHGDPFDGDAGRLLQQMLRALKLIEGGHPVFLMRAHRGVASGQPDSPVPLGHRLAQDLAQLAPRVVLAMGPLSAQALHASHEPLGRLRGRVVPLAVPAENAAPASATSSTDTAASAGDALRATPLVATYHPAYLLRNPADKARAWADLCLAAEQAERTLARGT